MSLTKSQLRIMVMFDVLEVLPKVPKTAFVSVGEAHHANQNQTRYAYPCPDVLDVARKSGRAIYHRGNCSGYQARPQDNFASNQGWEAGSTEARPRLAHYAGSNTEVYGQLADWHTAGRVRLTTNRNSASPFSLQTLRASAVKNDRCNLTTLKNQIQKFFRYTKASGRMSLPEAFAVVQGSQPVRNFATSVLPQNKPSVGLSVAHSGDRGYLGTLSSMKSEVAYHHMVKRNVLCLQSLGIRRNPGNGPVVDPALDTYVLVTRHGQKCSNFISLFKPKSERSANTPPAHIASSCSQTGVLHLYGFVRGIKSFQTNPEEQDL